MNKVTYAYPVGTVLKVFIRPAGLLVWVEKSADDLELVCIPTNTHVVVVNPKEPRAGTTTVLTSDGTVGFASNNTILHDCVRVG